MTEFALNLAATFVVALVVIFVGWASILGTARSKDYAAIACMLVLTVVVIWAIVRVVMLIGRYL